MQENQANAPDIVTDSGLLAILDHLTGFHQGTRETITASALIIGSSPEADIHFPKTQEPQVQDGHALLVWKRDTYELSALNGSVVLVNDEVVTSHILESGDIIQLGKGP